MRWLALILLLDLQNLVAYAKRPLSINRWGRPSRDFTIVVPVFGHPRYWQNREYLERYPRENVLLAVNIATEEMARAADEWEAEGWRIFRASILDRHAPAALMQAALEAITTTYVVRLDGDTVSDLDMGLAVESVANSYADVGSVKVIPSRRETFAEKMQGVEYDVAMRGRHVRPWVTSGACMIVRREALRSILALHSMWFFGEDVEVGIIAKFLRLKAVHVDFLVKTDVPETFRALYRQRRGWWAGYFCKWVVNFDRLCLRFPLWALYATGVVIAMWWTKTAGLRYAFYLVPAIIVIYTLITVISNWPVRSRWMILFPYYCLVQALIGPPVGAWTWVRLAIKHRHPGRMHVSLLSGVPRRVNPLKKDPRRLYGAPVGSEGYVYEDVGTAWRAAFLLLACVAAAMIGFVLAMIT